jgi:hypothetical protein
MRPFYRASQYGMKNSVGYLVRRTANLVLPRFEALFAMDGADGAARMAHIDLRRDGAQHLS